MREGTTSCRGDELLTMGIMFQVADIFGIAGNIEVDEDRTTRTSIVGVLIAAGLTVVSAVFIALGIDPAFYFSDSVTTITGDRTWNTFGWVLGAVFVPLVVVFSHQFELRQSLSPDHIKDSRITRLLGVVLVLGLLVSTAHAFLGSAEIQFGSL